MAIEMVLLKRCQFCDDGAGDIFIDANAVQDLRVSQEKHGSMINHAKVVVHNSLRAAEMPCPHLVRMWMSVWWGRALRGNIKSEWGIDTSWQYPRLYESRFLHPFRMLISRLADGDESFIPQEPHEYYRLGGRWGDTEHVKGPRHAFAFKGRALFARRIPEFLRDLMREHDRSMAEHAKWVAKKRESERKYEEA